MTEWYTYRHDEGHDYFVIPLSKLDEWEEVQFEEDKPDWAVYAPNIYFKGYIIREEDCD